MSTQASANWAPNACRLSSSRAFTSAEVLAVDGYAPSIRPLHSGTQLLQHHCPIAHVATEFPELCEIETQLFARLLGTHVQRLATIAHGDGVCTTHVPHRLPTPAIPKRK
mgnify:CR=1 FL=1